jgi:DNA adenine methylase
MTLMHVRPISPVTGYVGGKRQLAKTLVPMLAGIEHGLYAEPFVGMGGLFFRRDRRPPVEAINDLSRDVATFFRILQRHYEPFMDMLKWRLSSRDDFERLMKMDPDAMTDLERAARFLQLQRLSFGGKVAGRTFGTAPSQPARFDTAKLGPLLEAAHQRLASVWIECLPYDAFIERYDRPQTLFFCDPPYWGSEHYYGRGMFERAEFERLAQRLKAVRGAFVMTVNDRPELREMFEWAAIRTVSLTYSVGLQHNVAAQEIIITNRPGVLMFAES